MYIPEYIRITNEPGLLLKKIIDETHANNIIVITDENTNTVCYPKIAPYLPRHIVASVPAGENNKNINNCLRIWHEMTNGGLDRNALTVNLGGGVICDMGGFCATTFKRGVRFINCPTTLLAQVDAGYGGKLGVNYENIKNNIGIFKMPYCVIISSSFLNTLSKRELRSGYAEMMKHALISGVNEWDRLEKTDPTKIPSEELIKQSIMIKSKIVCIDPKEGGYRKALNFGHTIGHVIESILLSDQESMITHGDAIAAGIVAEAYLSYKYIGMEEGLLKSICNYVSRYYPNIHYNNIKKTIFLNLLVQDKKSRGREIRAALVRAPGISITDVPVSKEACWESWKYYQSIYNK
ncbi:MAG TPA: 3-dehydroquinate synthase family protein [Syntrophales bacterium]|nr:3-dehydroquinate synthase family protein [Syntrophales bacterium]